MLTCSLPKETINIVFLAFKSCLPYFSNYKGNKTCFYKASPLSMLPKKWKLTATEHRDDKKLQKDKWESRYQNIKISDKDVEEINMNFLNLKTCWNLLKGVTWELRQKWNQLWGWGWWWDKSEISSGGSILLLLLTGSWAPEVQFWV